MKSTGLLILLAVVVVIGFLGCNGYNGLVKQDESVKKAFNNVQTEYQNRSDLVGNLVNTVKGAANFEQNTLTAVVEARAKDGFKADAGAEKKVDVNFDDLNKK